MRCGCVPALPACGAHWGAPAGRQAAPPRCCRPAALISLSLIRKHAVMPILPSQRETTSHWHILSTGFPGETQTADAQRRGLREAGL